MNYQIQRVELNQNGMNRIGYFIYPDEKQRDFYSAGNDFVNGIIIKLSDNSLYQTNGPYNYGSRIKVANPANSFEWAEHFAENYAEDLVKQLSQPIVIVQSKGKKKQLESVA